MPEQYDNLTTLALFEQHNIRQIWHEDEWWFSIVDVVQAIQQYADYQQARKYWNKLKERLMEEGANETVTKCHQLKLPASDAKMRLTDCANTEIMLRLVQSIPSPRAEPFREWLAQVGAERLEEIADPEAALDEWRERAIRSYMSHGYSEALAKSRIDSIISRKGVTNQWGVRSITAAEFPILTDRLHMGTFGLSIQQHMALKGYLVIKRANKITYKGNLRAGMTILENAVMTFAENVSAGLHVQRDSQGFKQIARDVDDAATLARKNREEIERLTGEPVVSATNMMIEKDGGLWSLLPPPGE